VARAWLQHPADALHWHHACPSCLLPFQQACNEAINGQDTLTKGKPYYSERRSGSVRIDEILSAHKARATLEDSLASMGELVEFRQEP
jgi:hypothetical protein